jgi:hypothetical protein
MILRSLAMVTLLSLWPSITMGIEPPLTISVAGIQMIALVRPHGKVIPMGRSIEQILRNPLGN